MSGYREFYVKTSFLRKEGIEEGESAFEVLGQSRGTLLLKCLDEIVKMGNIQEIRDTCRRP